MIVKSENLCRFLFIGFALSLYLLSGEGVCVAAPAPAPGLREIILFDRYKDARKEAGDIAPVSFSHIAHSVSNECIDCHPTVFVPDVGANRVTEQGNMNGEFCGFCHGDRLYECELCHR